MKTCETEVLVVGGGPVGLTAACELKRQGIACRLIETCVTRSPLSKAATLHARTLEDLDTLGIAEEAVRRGRMVTGSQLFLKDRKLTRVSFKEMDSTFNFVLGFEQSETEALLEEYLNTQGGRIERGITLESFQQIPNKSGVQAQLIHSDGTQETVHARWLLGCDGASSTVRRGLGMALDGFTYPERVIHADVRVDWPYELTESTLLRFMHPEGAVSAVPLLKEGRCRLVVMLDKHQQETPDRATFQRLIDHRACQGAVVHEPVWSVEHRFHRRLTPRYRVGPVFLLGDAAHIMAPVGGMGMNVGIQDALNLIWKLALVTQGHVPESWLDTYETERRPVARAAQEVSERRLRGQYRTATTRNAQTSRSSQNSMTDLWKGLLKIKKDLAESTGMTQMHYPVSPVVVHDSTLSSSSIQPGLHAIDGPTVDGQGRTRRLLARLRHPGHTLLIFTGIAGAHSNEWQLFEALEARYQYAGLQTYFLLQNGMPVLEAVPHNRQLWDISGKLHQRYQVAYSLLRPDHYLGTCSKTMPPKHLTYFEGT